MTVNGIGIDKAGLRGRIHPHFGFAAMDVTTTGAVVNSAACGSHRRVIRARAVLGDEVPFNVDSKNHGLLEASFEFSVPKFLFGSNVEPATLVDALGAARRLYEATEEFVTWAVPFSQLRWVRLDVVRTFVAMDDLSALLDGLARVKVPRGASLQLYGQTRTGAQTITRGNRKTRSATLYDKQAEREYALSRTRGPAREHVLSEIERARGQLRFEASFRTAFLRRYGIEGVGTLNDGLMRRLAREAFDWAGFGVPVAGASHALKVIEESDLSESQKSRLIGDLVREASGAAPRGHRNTQSKNRLLCRRLGLTAADLAHGPTTMLRLDYDAGTLVYGVEEVA